MFINPEMVTESMSLQNDDTPWLTRGRQRAAIAQTLRKPMTATEICAAARTITPRIQLRDVWFLMQQFEKQGLAICSNPKQSSGRVYCLTEKGRAAVFATFDISMASPPEDFDWRRYSYVIRA